MFSLNDLFDKLGRDELAQEDFAAIRLRDLPENEETEADVWAFHGIDHTGEAYGQNVIVTPEALYHVLVDVTRRQQPFTGKIVRGERPTITL